MKKAVPVVYLALCLLGTSACLSPRPQYTPTTRQALRQAILNRVSALVKNTPVQAGSLPDNRATWHVLIRSYEQGEIAWQAEYQSAAPEPLAPALAAAVHERPAATGTDIMRGRLWVSVDKDNGDRLALVEYRGRALEGAGDAFTAVRKVDKALITAKVADARRYLLDAMDPRTHGFHKLYNSRMDTFEDRVRTVYSASSLWSLLKLNDLKPDREIQSRVRGIVDFLLSMQVDSGPLQGAFYYSLDHGRKRPSFTVGTAAKTIFTLLDLYRRFGDSRYLTAAAKAGDWLLSTQREDGTVVETFEMHGGVITHKHQFSWLYHCQVLSALSRLYGVTADARYLRGAQGIEGLLLNRAVEQHYFLKDEYRPVVDPVPTAWGVMSLLDFYKVTHDNAALDLMWKLAGELMRRQQLDPGDIWDYGRFAEDTFASSNGWINEVLSEVYLYGSRNGWDRAQMEKVRTALLLVTRWLIQNTYSPENTYNVKNPRRAIGGLPRNFALKEVRTDAVCHAVNGYLNMLAFWPQGTLLEVPEAQTFKGTASFD